MTTNMSSPVTSPPSSQSPSSASATLSTHLDSQIARLNAQITALRQEKQSLANVLLASSTVQNIVQNRKSSQNEFTEADPESTYRRLEQAVAKQQARNDIKVNRLMNNVTSFPFTDPAPDRQQNGEGNMLGLRFEMPFTNVSSNTLQKMQDSQANDGEENQRVYLVMLRRIQYRRKTYLQFQPEMNQIPKHIDVEGYAAQYLPFPDIGDNDNSRRSPSAPASESFQDDSGIDVTQDLTQLANGITNPPINTTTQQPQPPIDTTDTNQSLHLFVSTTRDALLSWHYRKSYIEHITKTLTLLWMEASNVPRGPPMYKFAITHLQSNLPATQLTIDWINGTTALLGITEKGHVGIARVFGPRVGNDDEQVELEAEGEGDGNGGTYRCHSVERKLEGIRLDELVERLQEVGMLMRG